MIEKILISVIAFIVGIIVDRLFSKLVFINWKSYRKAWEPIYENRIEQFDKYLKYALNNRKNDESIEYIASVAAKLNVDSINMSDSKYSQLFDACKDYYLCELRSANIE